MVDLRVVFPNIGAFICAVFVLHYGADLFIDHTVIVSKRLKLNQTLIALLTAGAEWEELAVVIAALAQRKPALALGNVIGSCISNILGAFSLGLLFRAFPNFDESARIYALVLLTITIPVAISLATAGPVRMGKIAGGILVASFVLYILSIGWSIYGGIVKPLEVGQRDGDEESGAESDSLRARRVSMISHKGSPAATQPKSDRRTEGTGEHCMTFDTSAEHKGELSVTVDTPAEPKGELPATANTPAKRKERSLKYHVAQIIIGFLALSLSGYVLSNSASSLSSTFGLSGTVMGLTILSFATTLPEKLVAFLSGSRGHTGILVAATAGSDIFLFTLCIGVALLGTGETQLPRERLKVGEIIFLCAATCIFAIVVWLGTKRWVGG